MVFLLGLAATIPLLVLVAYALPWIEDRGYGYGTYSWAYAYVGAYTNGEKLINIEHDGEGEPYASNTPIAVYKYYYDSPDFTYAYTRVITFVDNNYDGTFEYDAEAFAYIEASIILSR